MSNLNLSRPSVNFYDFSQMYPQQNDVIRRYTEQVILLMLFLSTETYHRVTRK